MSHTTHIPPGWPVPLAYSHAIETPPGERTCYVAGQVGVLADGRAVDGIDAQTRQAFANLEAVLACAGMTVADVVKTTVFLTSADDIAAFGAARAAVLAPHRPASSLLIVQGLARPEFLVEVEAIASRAPDR